MRMSIKIGVIEKGVPVRISANSPNEHIAIFGISGTGKSTRIKEIIEDIQGSEGTVIAFDLTGQDFQNLESVNRIYAGSDGIALQMFDTKKVESREESYVNFISYLVDTFSNVYKLGVRQQGALRTAMEYAIRHCDQYETEMDAIVAGLDGQDSDLASGVHNKLWQILHGGIFRKSNKQFCVGKINILDFSGINPTAQREMVEIMLSFIWKKLRIESEKENRICLVVDECQHFLTSNSILLEMLRESRKYGVNIILSTQSNTGFTSTVMSAVNQTAVQLYFRPSVSDMKKVADMIAPQDAGRWLLTLKKMKVGESIATGNFSVNGKEIQYPIIIRSAYRTEHSPKEEIKRLGNSVR